MHPLGTEQTVHGIEQTESTLQSLAPIKQVSEQIHASGRLKECKCGAHTDTSADSQMNERLGYHIGVHKWDT